VKIGSLLKGRGGRREGNGKGRGREGNEKEETEGGWDKGREGEVHPSLESQCS